MYQGNWTKMSQLHMMPIVGVMWVAVVPLHKMNTLHNTDIDLVLVDFISRICEYVEKTIIARYCSILWGESPWKEISEVAQPMFIHDVQLFAKQRWLEEISYKYTNLKFVIVYTTAIWVQDILHLKVLKLSRDKTVCKILHG